MLVSKKLRTLMEFFTIETPSPGVAVAGETLKFFHGTFRIVIANQPFQIISNHLVEALAESTGFFSSAGRELLING